MTMRERKRAMFKRWGLVPGWDSGQAWPFRYGYSTKNRRSWNR